MRDDRNIFGFRQGYRCMSLLPCKNVLVSCLGYKNAFLVGKAILISFEFGG